MAWFDSVIGSARVYHVHLHVVVQYSILLDERTGGG